MCTTINRLPSGFFDITFGFFKLRLLGGTERCNGVYDVETLFVIAHGCAVPLVSSAAGINGAEPCTLRPVGIASRNVRVLQVMIVTINAEIVVFHVRVVMNDKWAIPQTSVPFVWRGALNAIWPRPNITAAIVSNDAPIDSLATCSVHANLFAVL